LALRPEDSRNTTSGSQAMEYRSTGGSRQGVHASGSQVRRLYGSRIIAQARGPTGASDSNAAPTTTCRKAHRRPQLRRQRPLFQRHPRRPYQWLLPKHRPPHQPNDNTRGLQRPQRPQHATAIGRRVRKQIPAAQLRHAAGSAATASTAAGARRMEAGWDLFGASADITDHAFRWRGGVDPGSGMVVTGLVSDVYELEWDGAGQCGV